MTGARTRLHADEVPIDEALVRRLLAAQFPAWADRPLQLVHPSGTDNVVFRLGADLSVRLPRQLSAVPSLARELEWLPRLAAALPLEVPVPVAAGEPGHGYPFPWAVCQWVEGTPLSAGAGGARTAQTLGEFVLALRSVDTAGGPRAEAGLSRGGPVQALDDVARAALDEVCALVRAAGSRLPRSRRGL